MHPHTLSDQQKALLPLVIKFKREFYLMAGPAIALQIGHRQSIDLVLFNLKPFNRRKFFN